MDSDQDVAKKILSASSRKSSVAALPSAAPDAERLCREAQNAFRAAVASSTDAIAAGSLLNRISKVVDGKAMNGKWTAQAQDSLRSAILFAGGGLDRALKLLVESSLPSLAQFDEAVQKRFEGFAEQLISDDAGTVKPRELVQLFLSQGQAPADVLKRRWISSLTGGSAQSVSRVDELASALGVTNAEIRRRTKPGSILAQPLQNAFDARNQIAHELDVTKPLEEVRKPLENIRAERTVRKSEAHVDALLRITQEIINDVAQRLAASEKG